MKRTNSMSLPAHLWFRTINLLLIPLILLYTGCTEESTDSLQPETEITITLRLPGETNGSQTKGLSTTDENQVATIDLLIFRHSGESFRNIVQARNISGTGNTRTFTVTLPEGRWNLLVLANSRHWISESLNNGNIANGTPYSTLQQELQAAITDRWIADNTSSGYYPIPMSGEIINVTINKNSKDIGEVALTRMLAAVDIQMKTQVASLFELEEVYLYNYNKKGLVIPGSGTVNIPQNPSTTRQPILYRNTSTVKNRYLNEIYLFEAAKGVASDHPHNICLVVGGLYKPTNTKGYYRIDFAEKSGQTKTYKDIKRNHRYVVTINSITSSGLPDEEKAYNSVMADMEISIEEWEPVFFDVNQESRSLVVNPVSTFLDPAAGQYTIQVTPTLGTGETWMAILSTSKDDKEAGKPDWITPQWDSSLEMAGSTKAIVLNYTVTENLTQERVAYLHIDAGKRLRVVVEIKQAAP